MTHHEHEPLSGARAAVMIGPLFEDAEAIYPYYRLQEAGATVELIGLEGGKAVKGKQGVELTTDQAAANLIADDIDILVIAGGFGPDKLRTDDGVKALVRDMDAQGKPVAFICHAGWVPVSAGILAGRRATSVPAIADDIDILVIAGGFGPDKLRTDDGVKALVRDMDAQGKPIAFICHAGWVPVSAGILAGRRATSVPAIADDMRNAGAEWEDSDVVVDGNLVSSRRPPDLPAFMSSLIRVAVETGHAVTAG